MQKNLVLVLALLLLLSACTPQVGEPKERSVDELRAQLEIHKTEKKHLLVYEDALQIIELDAEDTQAYLDAVVALAELTKEHYAEIDRLLALATQNVKDTQVLAKWARENQPQVSFTIPFISDTNQEEEINYAGTIPGNLTNAAKYWNNWWQGGLLAWQGDWVYFSQPNEDFALYKVRADGSDLQRLGDAHGHSINVTGNWVTYLNPQDGDKIYKMRTDGSMNSVFLNEESAFVSVAGDWVYFAGDRLYKMRHDSSEKIALTEELAIFPCVYEDFVYYAVKSESGGLWRVSVEGGEPKQIAQGFVQTYCLVDDWVYYVDHNQWHKLWRVKPDGTGAELVFDSDEKISAFNVSQELIYLSLGVSEDQDGFSVGSVIVALNRETLEKVWSVDADTEPLCLGPEGKLYFFKYRENMAWYSVDQEGHVEKIR